MNGLMNGLMFLDFNCVTDCGGADILRIIKFVFILLDLVFFIVPIGLIVMIMIDFSKNVIAGKEDEMKKNLNVAIKRIIYCIVLFLVPTIVNFAVGLVSNTGDNIVAKASYCVDYAKNEDLSICEVDYGNFEAIHDTEYECYVCDFDSSRESIYVWDTEAPASNYGGCNSTFKVDNSKTSKDMCKVTRSCYKCVNDDIFIWGTKKPNDGSNGCSGGFSEYPGLNSQDKCNKTNSKQCYKCLDGSGYVLSIGSPSSGFVYTPENSFNYHSTSCGPGFNSTPVDNCNCTTTGCSEE